MEFRGSKSQSAPAVRGKDSDFQLPEGNQWRYSEFVNAVQAGKVERVRFSKEGGQLQVPSPACGQVSGCCTAICQLLGGCCSARAHPAGRQKLALELGAACGRPCIQLSGTVLWRSAHLHCACMAPAVQQHLTGTCMCS